MLYKRAGINSPYLRVLQLMGEALPPIKSRKAQNVTYRKPNTPDY